MLMIPLWSLGALGQQKRKYIILSSLFRCFSKLKMFLKPYSECPFHGYVKNNIKIKFSCRNYRVNKCRNRCKMCDEEEEEKERRGGTSSDNN